MADNLEQIKISELPLVSSYVNLYTIGTDGSLNSVKVPLVILSKIGDLTALTTTDKSSLVAAINEVAQGGGGSGSGSGGVQNITIGGDSIVNNQGVGILPVSTNVSTDANTDKKLSSPKSVKTYVDGIVGNIETLLAAI